MSNALPYLAIVLLILCSSFFSASEMALSSSNRRRLKRAAEKGSLSQRLAFELYENYENTLSVILVWNNMVNNAVSSIATVLAMSYLGDNGSAVATLVVTVLILVFGETVPKILSKQDAERFTTIASIPLKIIAVVSTPIVFIIVKIVAWFSEMLKKRAPHEAEVSVTEDELVSIIETIEDEGVIDEEQSDLLQSAVEFADQIAKEILTPRVEMATIDIDDDLTDIMDELKDCPYSRIPVYEDTIDNIIGILYVNELLSNLIDHRDVDIRTMMVEPFFINETMKLPDILMDLRRKQMHMAIVLDEYGGTLGMVTMEDILEQIVGDIWDETDIIVNDCVEIEENVFEVKGEMNIFEFIDFFDLDEDNIDSEYVTVGGWVSELLEDIPELNDEVRFENLLIKVTEVDDIRASKLLVRRLEKANTEELPLRRE